MLGYGLSLVGATVKTVALQVATMALNAAITMGASVIVSGIVTAISNWIRQDEILAEKAENAKQKINELNNEYKTHSQLVSDSAKRYAELAQSVDQLSGKNLSLNDDDYKEFLDLSNQLAEVFPTLSRHYNENGQAILDLSGNVNTIVDSLNNLIEAERNLKNQEIVNKLPTIYKNAKNKSDDYNAELENLYNKRNALYQGLDSITINDLNKKFQTGLNDKYFEILSNDAEEYGRLISDYTKILDNVSLKYDLLNFEPAWNGKYDSNGKQILTYKTSIYIDSPDEDIEEAKNIIKGNVNELAKT